MTELHSNQSVIKVEDGWTKLPDEENDHHLELIEIVNWYYKNRDVVNVQYLVNRGSDIAYITLRRNGND